MQLHQCLLVRHVSMCKIAVIMVGLRISNAPMTYSKFGGGAIPWVAEQLIMVNQT